MYRDVKPHVCTSVEQDDRAFWSGLDVGLHALKVESDSLLVKVAVVNTVPHCGKRLTNKS
jgi:hypothetical protein